MKIIKGDLKFTKTTIKENFISCLICTARNPEIIRDLLHGLAKQTLTKDRFEIVVVDNSVLGLENVITQFSGLILIKYIRNSSREIMLGALRNKTIELSQGEYVLFLDDDTRIPQVGFLEKALGLFNEKGPDIIMPFGKALNADEYLDSYSYATRCCFYRRSVLERVGGFFDELAAYEDIDLGIRSNMAGVKILKTSQLEYAHPRLFFSSLQKPIAIGQSIFKLQKHYPWYLWLLIYFNSLRFLPLGLIPTLPNRQWFKISWGVLIAPFVRKEHSYRVG